jgi:galactokinase
LVSVLSSFAHHPSTFTVAAPGRVNLIGEHTDYNDGLVLPMAIQQGIKMEVRRSTERHALLQTLRGDAAVTVDLTAPIRPGRGGWSMYLEGVLAGYQELGWEVPGFELSVSGTLPAGSGLSSSAALEVGMATVVETLCGRSLPLEEKALLCQRAEHVFAGVPCGIMDQFAVTFGRQDHALLLDCRSKEIRYVPMNQGAVSVLIINSGVKHSLADGQYAVRRAQCVSAAALLGVKSLRDVSLADWESRCGTLPLLECQRARHVITEHERTLKFMHALEAGDWGAAGEAMYGSHASLSRDYEVSCEELDQLVSIGQNIPGVHGCRMTGGGFGGCVVALVQTSAAAEIMAEFRQKYLQAAGICATMFLTQAAAGPLVTLHTHSL